MSVKFNDHTAEFLTALDKAIDNGLEAIGMTAEGHAKRKITQYPAVDTGRYRNSITFAISGEKPQNNTYKDDSGNTYEYSGTAPDDNDPAVYIGTNVEYGPFVELGTSKMSPRPSLKPAATGHSDEYKRIMDEALKNAEK